MIDIRTGKEMTRRDFGRGLAAIIGAGVAPSIALSTLSLPRPANGSVGGLMRGVGARVGMMGGEKLPYDVRVEYIENSGVTFDYVDTGLNVYANSIAECEFQAIQTSGLVSRPIDQFVSSNQYSRFLLQVYSDGKVLPGISDTANYIDEPLPFARHIVKIDASQKKVMLDGRQVLNTQGALSPVALSLYLFARNSGGGAQTIAAKSRIFYFKMWRGTNLVCDAIPVKLAGVPLFYDFVRSDFLSYHGSFTAGPEI